MKKTLGYILGAVFILLFASCAKDNYDSPNATLAGRIVYNGEPINVEYNQVYFELWEQGWDKPTPIGVNIAQDGGYSSVLFNGTYKLIFPGGQGPFMLKSGGATKDTIVVSLSGNQKLDIEVLPYYMVRNTQFTASSNNVTAAFKLEKIITDGNSKNIERVTLYINKTQFVSEGNNVAKTSINGPAIVDPNNVSLSVGIPTLVPSQNYVYARVGVKISNVEDWIFSPVKKISF
ncbi:DUF3823 domain-containing protein [Paraflavitalea speifideaquila]|uniref:DUF3823 domain-containing protein n=1 Tax=Paraflavitalea speifideaquila TaxID=3076558 RepID=UPI0028E922EF|nr:DUF3823 domain-containing protein [Paraflavitalea speifideiaquila]